MRGILRAIHLEPIVLVILGYLIVLASVFGGFALSGGHLAALFQPIELLMIGGAAFGAFIVGNNGKSIKATIAVIPSLFHGSGYTQARYLDLLALLSELLGKVRREGMMSIEADLEAPAQSALFASYPLVLADHHAIDFICDYLRLMVAGNVNLFQIESLMDHEIETHHHEAEVPSHCIARLGDAMPAFGIVAAVMGVVHTMESMGLPPEQLGILIARALVGTFLGILLAYGFIGPVASLLEQKGSESTKLLHCIKATLMASFHGCPPALAVEFGRKVLYSTERPGFSELEAHLRSMKER